MHRSSILVLGRNLRGDKIVPIVPDEVEWMLAAGKYDASKIDEWFYQARKWEAAIGRKISQGRTASYEPIWKAPESQDALDELYEDIARRKSRVSDNEKLCSVYETQLHIIQRIRNLPQPTTGKKYLKQLDRLNEAIEGSNGEISVARKLTQYDRATIAIWLRRRGEGAALLSDNACTTFVARRIQLLFPQITGRVDDVWETPYARTRKGLGLRCPEIQRDRYQRTDLEERAS